MARFRRQTVVLIGALSLVAGGFSWLVGQTPASAGTERVPVAYVTDAAGFLDEVNLSTGGILARAAIPGADALAVNAAGTEAYVSGGGTDDEIYPVDLASMTVELPIHVIDFVSALVFDPTGTTLWAVSTNGPVANVPGADGVGGVTPIDVSSNPPTPGPAIGLPMDAETDSATFNPSGTTLYLGEAFITGGVIPVNIANGTLGTTIPTDTSITELSAAPSSNTAYALLNNGTIQPIDLADNTAGTAFGVGADGSDGSLAISAAGGTAYLANSIGGSVIPVDLATQKATGKPIAVKDPQAGILNSTGTTLYETAGSNGAYSDVAVIDITTDTLIKEMPLPNYAEEIALGTATVTTTTTTTAPKQPCGAATGADLGGATGIAAVEIAGCDGYFVTNDIGQVAAFGSARRRGDLTGRHLNAPIIGIEATPDGGGYWLLAADGGIFNFGDARFCGSTGNIHLNAPVVGMAVTPANGGYWVIAQDGGVFNFGDAGFYGSTGNIHLNRPVDGIAVAPGGNGYWLVASDGGIFNFGHAPFHGSLGSIRLNRPIVGVSSTPNGRGYTLVGSDGGVFNFGDAPFYGSLGAHPPASPIVDLTPTPSNNGYYLVSANGQVYNFGPGTKYFGSA